jgi:hypothetical protein
VERLERQVTLCGLWFVVCGLWFVVCGAEQVGIAGEIMMTGPEHTAKVQVRLP